MRRFVIFPQRMKVNLKTSIPLLFSLVTAVSVFAAQHINEKQAFSFVQMCDTQLGMGGYEHDVLTFNQAVKQINELQADFVVICGDLVNNPDPSETFRRFEQSSPSPVTALREITTSAMSPPRLRWQRTEKPLGKTTTPSSTKDTPSSLPTPSFGKLLWKANQKNMTCGFNKPSRKPRPKTPRSLW